MIKFIVGLIVLFKILMISLIVFAIIGLTVSGLKAATGKCAVEWNIEKFGVPGNLFCEVKDESISNHNNNQ